MEMPWNEIRGFDPMGGYGYYSGPSGSGASSELGGGQGNPQASAPGMSSHMRGYNLHGGQSDLWQRPQFTRPPPMTPNTPHRTQRSEDTSVERAGHQHQAVSGSENHRFSANPARRSHRSRGIPGLPVPDHWPASGRRLPARAAINGDSDDEDDESIEAEYRRNSELLFDPGDEERALAAMRGALAVGKKVAARDFLANLEIVPIDQIPESERSCSICYETIGTENPEGLTEKAVRMPKCKHIFGDICIKKWCQDSDTCPYCRDKLPSELSVKKGLAAEYRLAQRERIRIIERARRSNGLGWAAPSLGPPINDSDSARALEYASTRSELNYRARDEVDSYVATPDAWGLAWSSGPSDRPSERRRATRGRLGNNRPNHIQGRPTSVGSSRFFTSAHQSPASQRQQGQGSIPPPVSSFGNHSTNQTPLGSIAPGLTRQSSNPNSATRTSTYNLFSMPNSEEASPPVAVGSGGPARDRQTADGVFRRSLDRFTAPRSDEWTTIRSPERTPSSTESGLGSPFHGITSPLRQHPTSEGNNTSDQQDDDFFARWSR